MLDLLIITVPFTYTFGPSLSPALLKACAIRDGISAQAWDISADFNYCHKNHEAYQSLVDWMGAPELTITKKEFNWYQSTVVNYAKTIVDQYNPKYLAVSVLTQNSQRFAEDICYHVKLLNPDIKILLGGSGVDVFQYTYQCKWYELLLQEDLADTVIIGEGEYALSRVILQNLTGVVKEPQLTNQQLSQVPVPDYDDYDFSIYKSATNSYWNRKEDVKSQNDLIFLVTASKGCVKNCSFCDVGKIWSKFRFRGAEQVANEIITLHEKYGATYFSFTDSLINGGIRVFNELNLILAEKIPKTIRYDGQMICRGKSDMPEKYFEAMARAGCYSVSMGIESGSEQVRMHMGKGSSADNVYYSTEMLIKYGIKQSWNIIAGYPTETDDDWSKTMDLIRYWMPRSNGLLQIVPVGTFLLLEGTPMTDTNKYVDLGLKKNVVSGYSGFAWTSAKNMTNTFDVRCKRFLELCNYLLEQQPAGDASIFQKILTTQKQLNWYRDEINTKKVFSLAVN